MAMRGGQYRGNRRLATRGMLARPSRQLPAPPPIALMTVRRYRSGMATLATEVPRR